MRLRGLNLCWLRSVRLWLRFIAKCVHRLRSSALDFVQMSSSLPLLASPNTSEGFEQPEVISVQQTWFAMKTTHWLKFVSQIRGLCCLRLNPQQPPCRMGSRCHIRQSSPKELRCEALEGVPVASSTLQWRGRQCDTPPPRSSGGRPGH